MRQRPLTALLVLSLAACAGIAALAMGLDREAFTYADGSKARFEQWRGQWVIVNYWAEWCAPCRDEIPELNELHAAHDDVTVVGVNFDDVAEDELEAVIERMEIAFPVVTPDPHAALGIERPNVIPTTFVIDPDGEVVERLQGPQSREDFEEAIGF